ncbi:MAG: SsrA-binding protein SmpB [candidate division WS1 bacterium]|jgi:SsrA-binding protein|nr:SsrA-binding protein SmpB [candidate division WS1 bacterium]
MAVETVATNRRAFHEYTVNDRIEAGIQLTGPEVKSVRAHKVSLGEGYATVQDGQVWLHGVHIAKYGAGGYAHQNPTRDRKLLLHKSQIRRLERDVQQKGVTLIPLRMYFAPSGYAKVELGICTGKREYEKRESIKRRDEARRTEQAVADHFRGR